MIWFFLGGMIAGAVGMVMYANWWMEKHTYKLDLKELKDELKQLENEEEKHD